MPPLLKLCRGAFSIKIMRPPPLFGHFWSPYLDRLPILLSVTLPGFGRLSVAFYGGYYEHTYQSINLLIMN